MLNVRILARLIASLALGLALVFAASHARAHERRARAHASRSGFVRVHELSPLPRSAALPVVAADLVAEAQRFAGARNFTGFRGPWCKAGLNIWLERAGYYADRSLRAIDALGDGARLRRPALGAIAVMKHHVAIVTGILRGGVQAISANHGNRVGMGFYSLRRILAFIQPRRI
jgi:hypothetical protein